MFYKGIKVLSLFFIDEVAKYKVYDENKKAHNGEYAKIFEEEYNNIFNECYNFLDEDYKKYLDLLNGKKVHSGYFSIDKKASISPAYEQVKHFITDGNEDCIVSIAFSSPSFLQKENK